MSIYAVKTPQFLEAFPKPHPPLQSSLRSQLIFNIPSAWLRGLELGRAITRQLKNLYLHKYCLWGLMLTPLCKILSWICTFAWKKKTSYFIKIWIICINLRVFCVISVRNIFYLVEVNYTRHFHVIRAINYSCCSILIH